MSCCRKRIPLGKIGVCLDSNCLKVQVQAGAYVAKAVLLEVHTAFPYSSPVIDATNDQYINYSAACFHLSQLL